MDISTPPLAQRGVGSIFAFFCLIINPRANVERFLNLASKLWISSVRVCVCVSMYVSQIWTNRALLSGPLKNEYTEHTHHVCAVFNVDGP